ASLDAGYAADITRKKKLRTRANPHLSWMGLARRGASTGDAGLMEQAGRAAGDRASGPGANAPVAHLLVRRLRGGPRQPATRAAAGPALGALGPVCEELAGLGQERQCAPSRRK